MMNVPTLEQLQQQCDAELAAIDARLAADLGDLDQDAEMALPFVEFQARCVRRLEAAAEKRAVIEDTRRRGAVLAGGS
jgi:hypothetical protein